MNFFKTHVLNKMGVQYSDAQSQYEAFKKTAARRRLMKKTYEENVRKFSREIIEKLTAVTDVTPPQRDPKMEAQYNTLRDTFDAFDKDGSAELGYPEYVEAWKFLNRPGGEREIKRTVN